MAADGSDHDERTANFALREAEAYHRQVLDALPDAIFIYVDDRLVYVNDAAVRVLGATAKDELVGRPALTFVAPAYVAEQRERRRKVLAERCTVPLVEQQRRRLDGRIIWVETQASFTIWEGRPAVLALVRDITARKEAEAQHRHVLDMLPDAVLVHVDGKVVFVNEAAVTMIGARSKDDLIGQRSMSSVPPEYAATQAERYRRVLAERCTLPVVEQPRKRRDGKTIWVESKATFTLWDGKPAFLGVMRDVTARREAEAALHEAQTRFQAITENIPGAVYERVLLPDGRVEYPFMSAGVKEFSGIDAETVMAAPRRLLDRIEPESAEAGRAKIAESAATMVPFDIEFSLAGPDDSMRLIRSQGRPRRRADGAIVWDGLMMDITRLRETEARARQLHGWLLGAIESMPNGFMLWDADDRLVMWNQRIKQTLPGADRLVAGTPFEHVLRVPYATCVRDHGKEAADVWLADRRRLHREANGSFQFAGIDDQWLSLTERRTSDGFTVTIVSDITERKRNEDRRRESETRYRTLIDLSPDAIYVHREGRIVLCNEAAIRMFGAANADVLIGRNTLDLIDPDFHELVRERQAHVAAAGTKTVYMRQRRLRLDGTPFWAEVTAAIVDWEGARGGIVIVRDISSQMRAEELLRRSKESAELANRAKTEFLANISHELRTPLNAIIGFSDVMQRELFGPLGSEQYRAYTRDIYQSGTHLHEVINDILDLSKIEAGKLELREEMVDVVATVRRCIRLLRPRADRGEISLEARLREPLPQLHADHRKVKQILINLLSNAVKFTPPGGTVAVEGRCDDSGALMLAVVDTGIGMSEADIPIALQPFGQLDSALDRKYEGTGLGLPLTKSLVELHGGTLAIDSVVGKGTRVTVRFPRDRTLVRTAAE
jgi:two-component system cell cycle sensor histidine kinase PleC